VVQDEYQGAVRFLHVETPAGRVIARVAPDARYAPGTRVRLALDERALSRFDSKSGRRIA